MALKIADQYIRVVDRETGKLLRELTLCPTKDYQPLGRKPGTPEETLKCDDVPRHLSTVSRDITSVGLTGFEPATP